MARDLRERPTSRAEVDVVRHLEPPLGDPVITDVADPHEVRRIAEWKRAEQKTVDETEHGRAGANAEGDDRECERRESEVASQCA